MNKDINYPGLYSAKDVALDLHKLRFPGVSVLKNSRIDVVAKDYILHSVPELLSQFNTLFDKGNRELFKLQITCGKSENNKWISLKTESGECYLFVNSPKGFGVYADKKHFSKLQIKKIITSDFKYDFDVYKWNILTISFIHNIKLIETFSMALYGELESGFSQLYYASNE